MSQTIAIVGASGAIGQAFAHGYAAQYPTATLRLFSRQFSPDAPPNAQAYRVDYSDEITHCNCIVYTKRRVDIKN